MNTVLRVDSKSVLWDLATVPDRLFGRQEAHTSMSRCMLWTRAIVSQGAIMAAIALCAFFGPLLTALAWAAGLLAMALLGVACAAAFEAVKEYLPIAAAALMAGLVFWAAARDMMRMMRLAKRWHVLRRRLCPLVIVRA